MWNSGGEGFRLVSNKLYSVKSTSKEVSNDSNVRGSASSNRKDLVEKTNTIAFRGQVPPLQLPLFH